MDSHVGHPGYTDTVSVHRYFTGTKMIDSVVYNEYEEYWSSVRTSGPWTYSYKKYLREDTTTHKVYGINAPNGNEYLLYDYNYQVGDSVFDPGANYSIYYVDSLITININGIAHKAMHYKSVSHYYIDYWVVEGIGSLVQTNLAFPVISSDLICFSNKGSTITPQHPFKFNCADSTLNVMQHTITDYKVKVYPQPAHGKVNIKLPDLVDDYNMTIYNKVGDIVFTERAKAGSVVSVKGDYSTGVYVYKVTGVSSGAVITGKVIFN
ncbi:MAG: T9SS type A sorting domain-containing protein [Chitinophagales bacterium]|nr:T9SS type A sorting domain-containing protein [Chitinophagales bacterium]